MERTFPQSLESEQGVLGCIFLLPNECMSECISRFKPGPDVFYGINNRTIYETLVSLFEEKKAIDPITVVQCLKDKNQLESVGGISYLASLSDTVPSAANLPVYISTVLEKYLLRKMVLHCIDFPEKIYEHQGEVDGLIEEFESSAMSIANSVVADTDSTVKELVKGRMQFYEDCHARGGGMLGLSTGYTDLDRVIDGLKPSEMIVIAARPSVGKTSLAMNIAENLAVDQKIPVGVFSLEMSKEALVGRMISSRARVNERTLTKATASEQDIKQVFIHGTKVAHAPIYIDDTGGMTVTQMRAKARRMAQKHKIKLIVIDYMQLLSAPKHKSNQQEEMAEVSKGVKAMAKELHIPVIAICQLNRELEKDKERKPRVSDLRESGQIEQDADVIGMLYSPDPETVKSGKSIIPVNLLIAKQRNGPTHVDVPLTFFKDITRFESASKFEKTMEQPKSWAPVQKELV